MRKSENPSVAQKPANILQRENVMIKDNYVAKNKDLDKISYESEGHKQQCQEPPKLDESHISANPVASRIVEEEAGPRYYEPSPVRGDYVQYDQDEVVVQEEDQEHEQDNYSADKEEEEKKLTHQNNEV